MIKKLKKYITNNWKGDGIIWRIFFIDYVLIGNIFSFLSYFLWLNFIFLKWVNNEKFTYLTLFSLLFITLNFFYIVWVFISFWRATKNQSDNKKIMYRLALMLIILFAYMRLFYSNEIQYEPYIEIKDNSSTYYGASRMPSESEWKKINEGMTREEVRSIIIIKPVKTIYDDGSEMWRYYSAPINDNEVDVTKSLKGESVFNVYFRDNKVRKKEISKF